MNKQLRSGLPRTCWALLGAALYFGMSGWFGMPDLQGLPFEDFSHKHLSSSPGPHWREESERVTGEEGESDFQQKLVPCRAQGWVNSSNAHTDTTELYTLPLLTEMVVNARKDIYIYMQTHLWSTSFCNSLQISSSFCCNLFLRCSGGRWPKSSVTIGYKSSQEGRVSVTLSVTLNSFLTTVTLVNGKDTSGGTPSLQSEFSSRDNV